MPLKLSEHLKKNLSSHQLLDPTLHSAPDQLNPWAVFCGWSLDWILAFTFATFATASWEGFVGPLGINSLPFESLRQIKAYGNTVNIMLTPVIFFSMHFLGILLHGTTLGLKLFKHRVETRSATSAFLWSWASTVSLALMGLPLLTDGLDRVALSETRSFTHHQWLLKHSTKSQENVPDLVQSAIDNQNSEEEFKLVA